MRLSAHFLRCEGNGPGESVDSSPGVIAPKTHPVRLVLNRRPFVHRKTTIGRGRLPGCPCLRHSVITLRPKAMGQNHPKRIPCEPTHLFPIKELIEELDSEVFWQIHRGTVVNLHAISKVIRETDGRPRIRLRDCPEILEVSRSYSGLFRGMLPQSRPIPTTEPLLPPSLNTNPGGTG